jgi:hypothetical protein
VSRQRLNDVQLWQLILLFGLIALVSGSKAGVFGAPGVGVLANLADRTPRWFTFLRFTRGRGWWWSAWQWLRPFDAMGQVATPDSDTQSITAYYWNGTKAEPAFMPGVSGGGRLC